MGNDTKTSQTTQHESEEEEEEEQDNPFARAKSKLKKAETRTPPDKMNLYKELDRLKKKKSTAELQHQLQDFLQVSYINFDIIMYVHVRRHPVQIALFPGLHTKILPLLSYKRQKLGTETGE